MGASVPAVVMTALVGASEKAYDLVSYAIAGSVDWHISPTRSPIVKVDNEDGTQTVTGGEMLFPEGTLPTDVVVSFVGTIVKGDKTLGGRNFGITAEKLANPETVLRIDKASNLSTFTIPEYKAGRDLAVRTVSDAAAAVADSLFPSS